MLWIEKYKPKSFEEYVYHLDIIKTAQTYSLRTIPHLLVHGASGHGKKTLIYNLLDYLYEKKIKTKLKIAKIKASSKEIEISYLESDEYIEITPCDYGFQDKTVIQGLIKNLAQTKPIINILKKDFLHSIRFIIINEADGLSKDAQAALRRTVEKYSCNFRIILVCDELNTIIEPLRSRCLALRIPGFSNAEIKENINRIITKEACKIQESDLEDIINVCNGNMRKALCLVENYVSFQNEDDNKRSKRVKTKEKPFIFLEYERIINGIVNSIVRHQDSNTVLSIRKEMYSLLSGCIPGRIILREMVRRLISISSSYDEIKKIIEFGSLYDERIKLGSKEIIHLEAFIISIMTIYA